MKYLLSTLILIATANIQIGEEPQDISSQFGTTIMKASIRLQTVADKRPFKLKNWNNSIQHTAITARLLASKGEAALIQKAIEEAKSAYDKNNFIILLEAIFLNAQGNTELANQFFEKFLIKSQTFSEFEETFMSWHEYHKLRRIVYELLDYRGISFEGREEEIQVRVPYKDFFKYVLSPGRSDFSLNVFFIVMIFGGALMLIFAHMAGLDFNRSFGGSLILFYMVIWISYGLWVIDLAFGLPFGLNRFMAVSFLLPITAAILGVLEIHNYWTERNSPLEKGYIRCRKCRIIILELAIKCPHCHTEVDIKKKSTR